MSDELERLQSYVSSLPPASDAALETGRTELNAALVHRAADLRTSVNPLRRSTASGFWSRRRLLSLGLATLVIVTVVALLAVDRPPSKLRSNAAGHSSSPRLLVRLVADDANVTVASGSYDMTFTDTTSPPTHCEQMGGNGIQFQGPPSGPTCQSNPLPSISGHGTVDTNPYAMVAVSQDGPLGTITTYDNGTDIWEIGGGDYGLAGPGRSGPGAPLSGFAGSVEGTVGQQAGALDMQGLASGTGYLDLEANEIQGAQPAGTGQVDGVPVTIYKLSVTGLQDPDLNGLSPEQVKTMREADAILQETRFSGKTTWVSVDADGYIRETRTTYTLSNGSNVVQDTVLSNFGCAGTVLMPGQSGSTAAPAGCVSPDTAGSKSSSIGTTPTSLSTTSPSSTTTSSTTSPLRTNVPPAPPLTSSAVLLLGDGIGSVHFGDKQASAITALSAELGSAPTNSMNGKDCTIDAAVQWANVAAYFDQGTFVGYSTLSINGYPLPDGNLVTAQGLRVGDTLAQAQQLYGTELSTSFAQGGSWSAATPEGKLEGYLSEEPSQSSVPTISSIEAGAVGCPAMTP